MRWPEVRRWRVTARPWRGPRLTSILCFFAFMARGSGTEGPAALFVDQPVRE